MKNKAAICIAAIPFTELSIAGDDETCFSPTSPLFCASNGCPLNAAFPNEAPPYLAKKSSSAVLVLLVSGLLVEGMSSTLSRYHVGI